MALSVLTTPRILLLGGARSGKSRYGETLAEAFSERVYIATAEPGDDEMRARIAQHQLRRNAAWRTVEAPIDLPGALRQNAARDRVVLVDCLTLWLTNLMLGDKDIEAATADLGDALVPDAPVILIANEVGLGIVPDNRLARDFRDAAGWLNQYIAGLCDGVAFVAAGLPLVIKENEREGPSV